jgi:hypothetical protein
MKAVATIAAVAGIIVLAAYGLLIVYDQHFPFGRLWETPAVRPHEKPLLIMESSTVPLSGGEAIYRAAPPETLKSPVEPDHSGGIASGQTGYVNYCLPCHGTYHDGNGTVGQSFYPLPGDLRSQKVQQMPDGAIFKEISYGIAGGRQPALATTIDIATRWEIIAYIKSLGVRP